MTVSYTVSIRFDEPLVFAWKEYQRTHGGENLSALVKALLRQHFEASKQVARPALTA